MQPRIKKNKNKRQFILVNIYEIKSRKRAEQLEINEESIKLAK